MADEQRVRLIEIDYMTGAERELPNYDDPGRWTWGLLEGAGSIEWREKHITSRYGYRTEPVPDEDSRVKSAS